MARERKFDDAKIELGKKLHRLSSHPDFAPFLAEIESRIETYRNRYENGRNSGIPDNLILCALDRCIELQEIKAWMAEVIDDGAAENLRKARQSEQDPQKNTDPIGAIGG